MEGAQQDKILQTWEVPGMTEGAAVHVVAKAGGATVVVGANGAGKSALGWHLEQTGKDVVKRLIAHRRLWLETAGPDVTSSQRQSTVTNMKNWSMQPTSRYLDHAHQQRTGVVLFDFLARLNFENAQIADAVRSGASSTEATTSPSVLDRVNAIFAGAGIPLSFSLTENSTMEARHSVRGATYPISQMSDGEKSALLLAAEVLSGAADITFIIDEPERHLHRSISAGLIASIMADRPDCHFVVLTHDLDLASALPEAATNRYVLNDCKWQDESVVGWELHSVASSGLPDEAREAVLGGRNHVVFLEGQAQSLDSGLYRLLFPGVTLAPVGSCDQVVRAVGGVRDSSEHHWLRATGIIDSDGRTPEEVAVLANRGVLVMRVSEIENLYYSLPALRAVAKRQAESLGFDENELYDGAIVACLKAMGDGGAPERLSAAAAEKIIYRRATDQLPSRHAIATSGTSITVQIDSPYVELQTAYRDLLATADLSGLLESFPIRDTPACKAVADALRFKSSSDYESAVQARLRTDQQLAADLRALIGSLPS